MELLSVTMNDGVMPRYEIEGKDNSSEDKSNYKVVLTGDMVYNSMRMWQGANGIAPCDGIVSPAYTVLMPKIPISNGYFAALFKSTNLINEFRKNSQGMTSDTWNLKYPQIETIKVCIPTLSEQERIADMLGTLEQRIAKQAQLVDSLKKYKRGLVNDVFSQRIATYSERDEWTISPFGEVVTINPKTGSLPDEFIYLDLECVNSGKICAINIIKRENAPSRAQRLLEKNDVLYQMVRPYQQNNYYYANTFPFPIVASTGYAQIKCGACDPLFVYEQISSERFAKEAMLRSTGTSYPAINAEDLGEIPFFLPSIHIQKKIGTFLSLVNQKIFKSEEKLQLLKSAKSSLLQQLFI